MGQGRYCQIDVINRWLAFLQNTVDTRFSFPWHSVLWCTYRIAVFGAILSHSQEIQETGLWKNMHRQHLQFFIVGNYRAGVNISRLMAQTGYLPFYRILWIANFHGWTLFLGIPALERVPGRAIFPGPFQPTPKKFRRQDSGKTYTFTTYSFSQFVTNEWLYIFPVWHHQKGTYISAEYCG